MKVSGQSVCLSASAALAALRWPASCVVGSAGDIVFRALQCGAAPKMANFPAATSPVVGCSVQWCGMMPIPYPYPLLGSSQRPSSCIKHGLTQTDVRVSLKHPFCGGSPLFLHFQSRQPSSDAPTSLTPNTDQCKGAKLRPVVCQQIVRLRRRQKQDLLSASCQWQHRDFTCCRLMWEKVLADNPCKTVQLQVELQWSF